MNKLENPGILNWRGWTIMRKAQVLGALGALMTVGITALRMTMGLMKGWLRVSHFLSASMVVYLRFNFCSCDERSARARLAVPFSIGLPGVVRLVFLVWYWMSFNLHAFEPPAADARRAAIGPLDSLSPVLRAALEPDSDFRPIPKPGPDDWLSSHREEPQTFLDFKGSSPRQPEATRRVIYLLPLGEFPAGQSPPLDKLQRFAAAYFQMEVKTLPVTSGTNFTTRLNPSTKNRQVLTTDVLKFLQARLPADAFCLLAITMDDLYPDASWNFVFGQASLQEGVGVYSFARYDPAFYGQRRGSDYESVLLRRSCKVLVHETGHMFGVSHCVFFACVMNGSNHLGESDSRPFHLCPVCLRKLQWSVKWDLVKRDESLAALYHELGFEGESKWTEVRLTKMKAAR